MKSKEMYLTTKYLLAVCSGREIILTIPNKEVKEQKFYLEYNNNGRKKVYAKGLVKRKTLDFFANTETSSLSQSDICARLAEVLKQELLIVEDNLRSTALPKQLTVYSKVSDALISFYKYKELQKNEGTVSKGSLSGYKHHQKKLNNYFSLKQFKNVCLIELNANIWLNYRIELLSNTHNFGKIPLKNSSVNTHFQYISQFYYWLIDFNELPIKNHLKKFTKLKEIKQEKRFKVIQPKLLIDFYTILETYEKYYFTRLYLSALLIYENNVRLSEQVLIQAKDIDLNNCTIRIINNKGNNTRTIIVSSKVKELIEIIVHNTLKDGGILTEEMYLIGGDNKFKNGVPKQQKDLGELMRRFRNKYPQFAGRTLYEHKHTSITNQFDSGIDPYQIKERAAHKSIKTTEVYLQESKLVKPYELKLIDK